MRLSVVSRCRPGRRVGGAESLPDPGWPEKVFLGLAGVVKPADHRCGRGHQATYVFPMGNDKATSIDTFHDPEFTTRSAS
jgi:hypothetical protein